MSIEGSNAGAYRNRFLGDRLMFEADKLVSVQC